MNLFNKSLLSVHSSTPFEHSSKHTKQEMPIFWKYMLLNKVNRFVLAIAIILIICEFSVFKYFYPYASFINGDSYSYILSAFYNLRADTYPIGYAKFLRLFSVFSFNDTSLVAFQFFLIQASLIGFEFTMFYFYEPRFWIKVIIVAFCSINPVFLFLSNYVSSDSLFLGLSIFWFTLLIWIIHRPTLRLIIIHAIVISIAFMVRYNALFYPMIAIFAFFISRKAIPLKIMGLSMTFVLIFLYINFTTNQFKRISGISQFSPFSGWQMANNALYAYRFIDSSQRKQLPARFKTLDQDVRNYFDSTRDLKKHPQEMLKASTIYMWDPRSPLVIFENKYKKYDSTVGELKRWANVGPLYKDYGQTLIKAYPYTYLEYYLWPNFLKYYVPPVEFLQNYSTGVDSVPEIAKQWFWYRTNKLKYRTKDMSVSMLNYYPILLGTTNVIFMAMSIAFIFLGGMKASHLIFKVWICAALFWGANLIFSVFASPIALRFQLFPFVLTFILDFLLLDAILKMGAATELCSNNCEVGTKEELNTQIGISI